MKEKKERTISDNIIALSLGALALFLLLALISYSASDPCFSNYVDVEDIENWMGKLGSYSADGLLLLFGIGAFFLPIFFIEYTYRYLVAKKQVRVVDVFSSFLIFFIIITFLGIFFGEVELYGVSKLAGGTVGTVIGKGLRTYLNPWGSLILLLTLFCGSLIISYDLSRFFTGIKRISLELWKKRLKKAEPVPTSKPKPIRPEKKDKEKEEIKEEEFQIPEPNIEHKKPEIPEKIKLAQQSTLDFLGEYNLPPLSFLKDPEPQSKFVSPKELKANASLIASKLKDFGVDGEILDIQPGPVITMYEFRPAPGIKINRIVTLADDLAMALKVTPVRVVAPIPGKNAVGIEIPNRSRETVCLKKILASQEFITSPLPLTIALGTDIKGSAVVADLAKMPHLLVAGTTGAGKSVGLNSMILSLLYRCSPTELKFIMIDPKRIELSHYDGIPHLLHPVVIDTKEALAVLRWGVVEMEARYSVFKELGVKTIDSFNKKVKKNQKNPPTVLATTIKEGLEPGLLPRIVIVIDEMADLMMVNKEVEEYIARLAQMARAAGMYMIVATQRPSVDVITGLIKANFPSRISFRVSSKVDSRTVLDASGAEQLLATGDMLFLSPGTPHLKRIHGAFVTEEEIEKVVTFIKEQKEPEYVKNINSHIERMSHEDNDFVYEEYDPLYDKALEFVVKNGSASISLIQRYLRIGYNRAARIIEQMEREGVVGPSDVAGKPRKVLIKPLPQEEIDV